MTFLRNRRGKERDSWTRKGNDMTTIDFVTNAFSGGGPRNIYTISSLLNDSGFSSSILSFNELSYRNESNRIVDQFGISIRKPSGKIDAVNRVLSISDNLSLPLLPMFLFQEYVTRVAALKSFPSPDVYVSTFWQSVIPTDYVARKLVRPHLYFVQADETRFSANRIYKKMVEKTYRLDITKFTHSRWVKEYLDKNFGGNTEFIGMGINHNVFKPQNLEKKPCIFTIARGGAEKGFDVFVKAMNELKKRGNDFKVIIAGNRKFIDSTNDKFGFEFEYENPGWIRDDGELAALYESCIFVNTGRFEALPMPPLEAMACGSSVVLTDMPGAREYAVDGKNSLLCEADNPICFAEKVEELLLSDSLRSSLGKEGIETASRYTWEEVKRRMINLLKDQGLA